METIRALTQDSIFDHLEEEVILDTDRQFYKNFGSEVDFSGKAL